MSARLAIDHSKQFYLKKFNIVSYIKLVFKIPNNFLNRVNTYLSKDIRVSLDSGIHHTQHSKPK